MVSALPFLTSTVNDARAPSPWPPTGLWAKRRPGRIAELRDLRIGTYDRNSLLTFQALGAASLELSFADAIPRAKAGALDALLSSGDGGAGALLWPVFDHFHAIDLAISDLSPELPAALRTGGQAAVEEWLRRMGPAGSALLQAYRDRVRRP